MKTHGDLTAPCEGKSKENKECNSFDCSTRKSCSVLYGLGLRDSLKVTIDPDGKGGVHPFKVFCNMTEAGGLTQVGHDRTEYTTVKDWEGPCDYYAGLTYDNGVTIPQMVALIDISTSCKQYISWKCKSAAFDYAYDQNDPDAKSTYWKTRDGKGVKYFGGATPGTANCACGEDKSCFKPEKKCNCDTNDNVWREDAGYLTNSPDLPVKGFCAGDTAGPEEEGKYMVGPLTCTGEKT
ncbi:contactin-associated protein-like 2 [Lineus longissimus]|uniref:contactin-associated protein-like 2 n=1 Tax=Lineus longissimus TaxID=88925 RepID=UPI002B4E6F40